MPHNEHRKKSLRKAQKAEARNRANRSAMRTALKKARNAIEAPDASTNDSVVEAVRKLDKAAKTRLIHPNKAARLKSRLARAKNRAVATTAK